MRNEFEIFLSDHFGQADQETLGEALELFEAFNLPNYQDVYIGLLMDESRFEPQQLADNFKLNIHNDLVMLIGAHGISVNSQATIEDMTQVLSGLQVLENYEDAAAIIQCLDSIGANEDIAADLFALVTPKHNTHFMNIFAEVKSALLGRLREMYNAGALLSKTDGDHQDIEENVKRLRKLNEYDVFKTRYGFELVQAGVPLGMEFTVYADMARAHLDSVDDKVVALELIVLLAMSEDGVKLPQQTFQKWSQAYYDDQMRITNMDMAVSKLLSDITQAATEEANEANFKDES